MPLNDEQVRKDEELKHLEARKLRGDQLTPEEEKTLAQGTKEPKPESKPEHADHSTARDDSRPAGKGFR